VVLCPIAAISILEIVNTNTACPESLTLPSVLSVAEHNAGVDKAFPILKKFILLQKETSTYEKRITK
jgi:hypothetical protein